MTTNRLLAVLFCVAMLAGGLRAGEAGQGQDEESDMIVLINPNAQVIPPGIKIVKDDYVSVEAKYKNLAVKKESYLVKDVLYVDKDSNYSLAIEKRDEGRMTLAALYFTKALDNLKEAKWAPEYCNYGIGNAFFAAGIFTGYKGRSLSYAPAADYFKRALDANPKSRFLLDILVKLPVCYAEQDKLTEADAAIKDAETRIAKYREETGKLGAGYSEPADRAMVQLAIAKARISEKKVSSGVPGITAQGSRDLWHEAKLKSAKYPDLIGECVEGEFRGMIQMKQYTQAVTEANSIIEKFNTQNDYSVLAQLPAAYMSLGQANLAQGVEYEGKGNKLLADNAFADARWAFLNIIAQFFDNDDYVAQAHFLAGLCYEKLMTVEPTDAKNKAIREWQAVVANFPKSEFKPKSVDKLKHYGVEVVEAASPIVPPATPAPKVEEKKDPPKPDTPKKPKGK